VAWSADANLLWRFWRNYREENWMHLEGIIMHCRGQWKPEKY
jgi:hypothetical protein